MAIIALKAWYLPQYEPIREVVKRPHDLRLSLNSLLKSGLRADFLDDRQTIQESIWFQRYLEGDSVEFYVEGSGGYIIANIDLMSQEIYLTKQDLIANLEPTIYLGSQIEYPSASEAIRNVLTETLAKLNERSRLILTITETPRPKQGTTRFSDSQLRQLKKSLLYLADGTPVTQVQSGEQSYLLPSPNVCVELGYALESKKSGQLLLLSRERPELTGKLPFDLPQHQQLRFKNESDLHKTLPSMLESLLHKFSLLI